jgi:hypothetical protein
MSRTSWRRTLGALSASTLIAGTALLGAPTASADDAILLTGAQDGIAGVPQNLIMVLSGDGAIPCGSVQAPTVTMSGNQGGTSYTLGNATFSTCTGQNYQYTFKWIPSVADVWYISASSGGAASNAVRAAISPVGTTTTLAAPSTAKAGSPTSLTATVTANGGSQLSPPGTVQFSVQGGGNIGAPVALNGAVPATATINWTPATTGQVSLVATYIPGRTNNVISTTCGSSCTSRADVVQVTNTGVNVFLQNPPQLTAGVPAQITAVVSVSPPSGSATFTVNGSVIGSNVPVQSNGQVSTSWTPPGPGNYNVAVTWTGNNGVTGSAQETVNVGSGPTGPDSITVTPVGSGSWSPNVAYPFTNGSTVTLNASSASGAPVTLTEAGPCGFANNVVTATQGSGQCRIIASSPGGNGLAPASATYILNLQPGVQAPILNPPPSGRYNKGKTITLEGPGNSATNAGNSIRWKVTSGASNCKLRFKNNGAVSLKFAAKGKCNVKGTAPAVPGQWSKMNLSRHYRVV